MWAADSGFLSSPCISQVCISCSFFSFVKQGWLRFLLPTCFLVIQYCSLSLTQLMSNCRVFTKNSSASFRFGVNHLLYSALLEDVIWKAKIGLKMNFPLLDYVKVSLHQSESRTCSLVEFREEEIFFPLKSQDISVQVWHLLQHCFLTVFWDKLARRTEYCEN